MFFLLFSCMPELAGTVAGPTDQCRHGGRPYGPMQAQWPALRTNAGTVAGPTDQCRHSGRPYGLRTAQKLQSFFDDPIRGDAEFFVEDFVGG